MVCSEARLSPGDSHGRDGREWDRYYLCPRHPRRYLRLPYNPPRLRPRRPVLPMLKERLPVARSSARAKMDTFFLQKPLFYFFAASVLLQGLGYFYPTLYLPSYATSLSYTPTTGALLLALFYFSQIFGQTLIGYLSDNRVSVETLADFAPAVSAIAILTLWGLAHSLQPLIVFSLVYGFFGRGYVVFWGKMGMEVTSDPAGRLITFGNFASLYGVGNVITGPISANLVVEGGGGGGYGLGIYRWTVGCRELVWGFVRGRWRRWRTW